MHGAVSGRTSVTDTCRTTDEIKEISLHRGTLPFSNAAGAFVPPPPLFYPGSGKSNKWIAEEIFVAEFEGVISERLPNVTCFERRNL